jgi:hypothetical protein
MMSNRGLLLEVLPLLRLSLEMAAWAHTAFYISDEQTSRRPKGPKLHFLFEGALTNLSGQLYGFLSQFSHWGHAIHGKFIDIDEEAVSIVKASVRYRAMSLALCLVILDVIVEVIAQNLCGTEPHSGFQGSRSCLPRSCSKVTSVGV